jgi:hypothetical protein
VPRLPLLILALALTGFGAAQPSVEVRAGDPLVAARAVEHIDQLARTALAKLLPKFPELALAPIAIHVHSSSATLPQPVRADLHAGTAGLALLGRNEIFILIEESLHAPPHDLRTVVAHELVHALLDQYAGAAGPHVPRWLHEGLAQTLSGGAYLGVEEENLLWAVTSRNAPRFDRLERRFPADDAMLHLAYAQSYSFVEYLIERHGLPKILAMARQANAEPFHLTYYALTDESLAIAQADWENFVLFRSGAAARYLLRNCFSFVIILAVPLLAVVAWKRLQLNRMRKQMLARDEALAAAYTIGPPVAEVPETPDDSRPDDGRPDPAAP